MKNKEIENLLKQENNAPDILNNIKTPKTFVKREKTSFISKFSLKQRIVALSVACSLLVIAIITPLLIIFLGGMESYDKLMIKNFEDYEQIGVGVDSNTSSGTNGLGFISLGKTYASSGNKKHKLIGQKKNGEIEQLILKDMKTDKETTPSLALTSMWSGENFTIVNYRRDNTEGDFYISYSFSPDVNSRIYLIDNGTGKFYSLNDFSHFSAYENINCESNDKLFVSGVIKGSGPQNSLFELKIENGELKIEELLSSNDFHFNYYFVDRFSNIFIYEYNYSYENSGISFLPEAILVANNNYEIKTLNEELIYSHNKTVYTANGNYFINASAEKEENTFLNYDRSYTGDAVLIKKEGNSEYHYLSKYDVVSQKYIKYIEKVTWLNDVEFTTTEIILEDFDEKYVYANNKLYFLRNNEVFSISIYDGTKESLVSDYLFNDIQTNNLGEVLFTAINKSDRQAVNGKINKEGEIEINFQKIKYDVLYIKPLN